MYTESNMIVTNFLEIMAAVLLANTIFSVLGLILCDMLDDEEDK